MFMQAFGHLATYYAGCHPGSLPERAGLADDLDCDVVIVGAGFSGLHCALRLARAGKRVVVLEASRVAWAASGRNGGQALLGWSCDMPPLEKALGLQGARQLWDSMCWAAEELRALPARHGFEVDYRVGSLWTAVLPRRVAQLREAQHEALHKWGYHHLRLIEGAELREWVDSPRYVAALHDARGAHLNPLKLAQGLATAVEQHDGRIFERTRALAYETLPHGYRVRTPQGEVRAEVLILACNAYLDKLDPSLSQRLLPVGSYQVATAVLDPQLARSLLPHDSCVIDNQFVPDYFRLTPDHRLLFGGGCTYLGGCRRTCPRRHGPIWSGYFPSSRASPSITAGAGTST